MSLPELMTIILTALLALVGSLAVIVLNSIKGEIRDIKKSVFGLEKDLRDGVSSLDRRVSVIENRHEFEAEMQRRATNGIHQ